MLLVVGPAGWATVRLVTDGLHFPLGDALGYQIESGDGTARAWLTIAEIHLNPHGSVHGAVPYFLLDTAMGGATMSVLGEGLWCTTVDIRVAYLSPCFGGTMAATATVRKAGRRLVFVDAVVTGDADAEYASASGVFAVIPAGPSS